MSASSEPQQLAGHSMPILREEVAKHDSLEDCWVVLNGYAYDLTNFLNEHPGGSAIIMKYAGKDGSRAFNPLHPKDIVKSLPKSAHLGPVTPFETPPRETEVEENEVVEVEVDDLPDISQMINVWDFEAVAKQKVTKEAWAYLMSGADDELSLRENHAAFHRVFLKPKVLVDVENIDMSTTLFGQKFDIPMYITATALGKLYHEDGECCLTRGANLAQVPQMCPTLASCTMDEMHAARVVPEQQQWWQLYVNKDKNVTRDVVEKAERLGFKALCVTVDAPQLGRRERDMRHKAQMTATLQSKQKGKIDKSQGIARAISSFIDPSLNWKDIAWLKSITNMPIILKGIQTGEDAIQSYHMGVQGIVVSNHGGRQLDFARSGIEMLVEVMDGLRSINADLSDDNFNVFMDGGVRRGSDVFKALALGAKMVGIGRPAIVGMAAYGEEGVDRVLQIFKDELEMTMRLMGTPTIASMQPNMVITRNLADHFTPTPNDHLSQQNYVPLPLVPLSKLLSKL